MTITQQQALEALDSMEMNAVYSPPALNAAKTVRQYIEQSTAQPQAVVPAPVAWALGDARYVHATNLFPAHEFTPDAEYAEEWTPLYDHPPMQTQPSAQAERAPVVQAVQAGELIEQEMAMLIRRLCSTTANDKTRAQAMEYLFKRGHASPLRADSAPSAPVQTAEHPPLPEGVKARFKCEDCDGTGYTGEMIPGSEFQPPEPVGCTSCNFTGWWAECEAYSDDQMHAYVDADRASSGATPAPPLTYEEAREVAFRAAKAFRPSYFTGNGFEPHPWVIHAVISATTPGQIAAAKGKDMFSRATPADVRMLTSEEHEELENALGLAVYLSVARAIQRKFCAVNAGKRIPADGVIGGV